MEGGGKVDYNPKWRFGELVVVEMRNEAHDGHESALAKNRMQ